MFQQGLQFGVQRKGVDFANKSTDLRLLKPKLLVYSSGPESCAFESFSR